jgi:hypothetical protein
VLKSLNKGRKPTVVAAGGTGKLLSLRHGWISLHVEPETERVVGVSVPNET